MNSIQLFAAASLSFALSLQTASAQATDAPQAAADTLSPYQEQQLEGIEVTRRRAGTRRMGGAVNGTLISQDELFRAACCNLGESFTTNPSVDVNYSDAATGARQIRLLGLSGTYVQMLTENMPAFRGAAAPYSLGYVPGPWMKSIQVSKGNASVRNGYEAMTGQINVEYLKPEDDEGAAVNLYGDSESRFEANADANLHVATNLSTELLAHFENRWGHHDQNDDGFQDMPAVRLYNLQNRWAYLGQTYIFHGGLSLLNEDRTSGQTAHQHTTDAPLFRIGIDTERYEGYMKHAFVVNREQGASLALMASASMHRQQATYGLKRYDANEKNAYAQLMYETNLGQLHNISVGLSLNYDYLSQTLTAREQDGQTLVCAIPYDDPEGLARQTLRLHERETVPGAYAQYTFDLDHRLTLMAGLRADHSSRYGTFLTPRLHLKWQPSDLLGLRLSAGKGYRTPFALAENNYLMASGRTLSISQHLEQEAAWNYGISVALHLPLGRRTVTVNAEYYYTDFQRQTVVDYDSRPGYILISNLQGSSYSHTWQIDATSEVLRGLTLTAAYRRNIVKTTYDGQFLEKPLTSRYKALITASYKTRLGLWQADVTLQMNGGGRMPTPYTTADGTLSWPTRYHSYEQLSAQVTRWFRHFSVYVGGENLTAFRQKTPVYGTHDAWGTSFEPTMVWGPVNGAMVYAGVRINFGRRL